MHSSNLVCGDIVIIEEGMNIPCDGLVIKAMAITTDESAMTGESDRLVKETIEQCEKSKKSRD